MRLSRLLLIRYANRDRVSPSVPEGFLQERVQVDAPDLVVVAVARVFAPEVVDAFFGEGRVQRTTLFAGIILRSRTDQDDLVVLVRLRRIGQQFGRVGSRRTRVAAEAADVREQFVVSESDRLAVAAT